MTERTDALALGHPATDANHREAVGDLCATLSAAGDGLGASPGVLAADPARHFACDEG
jgi:hypothetical protein